MNIEEQIAAIAEKYVDDIMNRPADDFAIRIALKSAVIDGYQAGQQDAHLVIDAALDNVSPFDGGEAA
jgi:hypothetical protein